MAKKKASVRSKISAQKAEAAAKKAAENRTITIQLTAEQLAELTRQWNKLKPTEAAQLVFTDGDETTSVIKVAGYSYHGNTCCA